MARLQVTCINYRVGSPKHEYITHIGGNWGYNNTLKVIPESEAISDLQSSPQKNTYYVKDRMGDEANVRVVRHANGKYWLTTSPDGIKPDNLASLNKCNS